MPKVPTRRLSYGELQEALLPKKHVIVVGSRNFGIVDIKETFGKHGPIKTIRPPEQLIEEIEEASDGDFEDD